MQMKEVWSNTLDDRYRCAVVSKSDPYQGKLIIKDGDTTVHTEDVMISFGAPYGPDAEDVAKWQQRCAKVVDAL